MVIGLETWQNYIRSHGCGTKGTKYSIMQDVLAPLILLPLRMVRFTSLMSNTIALRKPTTQEDAHLSKRKWELSTSCLIPRPVSYASLNTGASMNPLVELAFIFVSVALGIRWISQTLIEYGLAKHGIEMMRVSKQQLEELEDDDEGY